MPLLSGEVKGFVERLIESFPTIDFAHLDLLGGHSAQIQRDGGDKDVACRLGKADNQEKGQQELVRHASGNWIANEG